MTREEPYEITFEKSNPVMIEKSIQGLKILGQEVATLLDEVKQPGRHRAQWDAGSVASGMYLYRLRAGEFVETKKLILLR